MAPSVQTKARPTRKTRRRNHFKKRINVHSKLNQEASRTLPPNSSPATTNSGDFPKIRDIDFEGAHVEVPAASSGYSTPKAQRFRIPEISTCPPAPKKQRSVVSNCSLQRTPIAFFAPPDLELFFFFALPDIAV